MELWQFNNYIKGYEIKVREQQKRDISIAWHTAVINNQKKIKPLNSYLEKIDKESKKKALNKQEQIEAIKKAKEIDKKRD